MASIEFTILGSSGFIGSRLKSELMRLGRNVYTPEKIDSNLIGKKLGKVIYCIGKTSNYLEEPFRTVEAHVSLLAYLLKNADFEKIIYLSSTRLYDLNTTSFVSENENLILQPIQERNLYDLSKALGENLILNYSNKKGSVARLSCVYAFDDRASGFLPNLIHKLKSNKYIEIESSGHMVRDYVYIADVLNALIAILEKGENGVYNVASGENITNFKIAEILQRFGYQIKFLKNDDQAERPICNIEKINSLNIFPKKLNVVFEEFII